MSENEWHVDRTAPPSIFSITRNSTNQLTFARSCNRLVYGNDFVVQCHLLCLNGIPPELLAGVYTYIRVYMWIIFFSSRKECNRHIDPRPGGRELSQILFHVPSSTRERMINGDFRSYEMHPLSSALMAKPCRCIYLSVHTNATFVSELRFRIALYGG